jgi:hypothetical protein
MNKNGKMIKDYTKNKGINFGNGTDPSSFSARVTALP